MAFILYRETQNPVVPSEDRAKGFPLTNQEIDGNFKSIQDELATIPKGDEPTPTYVSVEALKIPSGEDSDRPSVPVPGQIRYNTTTNVFESYTTTDGWQQFIRLSDIGLYVPDINTRIIAGTGLSGGGDLGADRTLNVVYGTTADTACEGNDARLSDARTPVAHTHDDRYYTESEADARFLNAISTAADSDKVDGIHASQFVRSDQNDSFSGVVTTTNTTLAKSIKNITISPANPSGGIDGEVWLKY